MTMTSFGLPSYRALRLASALALALATAFAAGCKKELEGPAPVIEPPSAGAEPPPVDPGLVCRAQLETEVTLHGADFSPVPIDIPHAPKVALPTVTLTRSHELDGGAVSSPDEVVYSGNPDPATDPTNVELLFWKSREEMSFLVNQEITLADGDEGVLEEGVWDVTIESPAGDVVVSEQSLAVVDKPTLDDVAPGIACLAQGARTVDLTGRQFLRNGSDEAVLAVEGVSEPFAITRSDCTPIAHEGIDAEVCNAGTVELDGSIEPGFPVLTVQNPATAACASEDDVKLRVVPPPTVDRVEPPLGCVAEEDRSFTVEGADFLYVDGEPPVITVGGMDFVPDNSSGCETVDTQGHDVERCTSLTFTIAQGQLDPELYEVTVTNPEPAGCDATASGALRLVPPPTIDDIAPPLVCVADSAREVVLTGADILVVDGTKPEITLDGAALDPSRIAVDESTCEGLSTDRLDVQRCTTLVLTLVEDGVDAGRPEVVLTNPAPAGCSDTRSDLLTVAPGPSIESVEPVLACSEDLARQLTIEGEGFLKVGALLPAVTIDGTAVQSVDSAGGCAPVTVNGLDVETCTSVVVTVTQGGLAENTRPEISLTNPDPAGCNSTTSEVLTVPPFLEVAMLAPLNVCVGKVDSAFPITLTGEGFLRVDGSDFAVTAGGKVVTPTDIATCEDLTVAGFDVGDVQSCAAVTGTFDLTADLTTAAGTIPVVVSNAANAPGCPLVAMTDLTVVDPPTVTGAVVEGADAPVDDKVCSGVDFVLTVTGSGFVEGAEVRLVSDDRTIEGENEVFLSPSAISATFSNGLPFDPDEDSTFDVIVENAGDCASPPTSLAVIEVNPHPFVFFVDPTVVFNEVSIDATVFIAGLGDPSLVASLELIGPDPATTATELTVVDDTKANRLIVNVPGASGSPTFLPGEYTVRVTSMLLDCFDDLPGGLTVTDSVLDALLDDIDPHFASPTNPTAVTVTGSGFLPVPRIYLTPVSGGTATALRAVEVSNTTQLTAIVPGGMAAGDYNVVLVNPDGQVDVLGDDLGEVGVTVTVGEPPLITDVTPDSLTFNTGVNLMTITGDDFDMTGGVGVAVDCLPPGGGPTESVVTSSIVVASTEQITLNADTSGITAGGVCTVTVTNLGDGASFVFSAISIKNSSENLNGWTDVTPMSEGRRALALVAGRPTLTSRFLYAIGGDDGDPTNAKSSVESVRVDVFGDLAANWDPQVNSLPAGRTLAGFARIGSFVYLTGGYDGTATVDTTLRAQVLDPLGGPEIVDLDAQLGDPDAASPALGEGLWMYRIAYTYPATDPSNPSGESIAGELFNVELPSEPDGIELTLVWDKNPAADGYRIYRTPVNGSPDDLALLATCPGAAGCDCSDPSVCRFTDDATETLGSQEPLPPGSLGVWHEPDIDADPLNGKAVLATERRGHATVAVKHPNTTNHPNDWVLYAFGGQDGGDGYLSDYEYAIVTVDPSDGAQTVSAWSVGNRAIGTGRTNLAAWGVRREDTTFIPAGSVYVFVGMGYTAVDAETSELRSGSLSSSTMGGNLVTTDGTNLDAETSSGGAARAAMCFGNSSKFLNLFGGETGAGSLVAGDRAGEIQAGPDTAASWNAPGGGSLTTGRAYCATAQESAFYFTAGGYTAGESATQSIERTVQ